MKFDLIRPCGNCPFRPDRLEQKGWLGRWRAQEIIEAITTQQLTFSCHKTTVEDEDGETLTGGPNEQHCAGALILLEKIKKPNQMMRIAERLRLYDYKKLDMDSPVFDSGDQFIEWHGD